MSDNYDITRTLRVEALIVSLVVVGLFAFFTYIEVQRDKDLAKLQVSEYQAKTALSMTKRIENLPISDERQAYLAFAAEAVNDNILTRLEYRKLDTLSKAADSAASNIIIKGYTNDIKTITNEPPLATTNQQAMSAK